MLSVGKHVLDAYDYPEVGQDHDQVEGVLVVLLLLYVEEKE